MERTVTIASVVDAVRRKILAPPSSVEATQTNIVHTKDATLNLRRVFRVVGFRMPETHRFAYIVYSVVVNVVVSFFFPISCLISYVQLKNYDLADIDVGLFMTSLQLFFNLLACDFKILTLVLNRHQWRACYPVMERLDARCRQSPQETEELRVLVRQGNRWVLIYIFFYLVYATSTSVGAFFKNRPSFNIYLPYLDYRRSTTQFAVVSFIEILLVDSICIQQAFDDSFAVAHVCILRGHMRILLLRFAKLGSTSSDLEENYAMLKQYIHDHKNYLELYDIIAPVIQKTVFIQFMLTAAILSTTLVNFMIIETDFTSRVGTFFYMVAIFLEISPVCYNAQCLMDDSKRLAEVIFHSNWIEQDVRFRKMLIFLMQRTQCTKDLMAGKLFPINLSCCLSIVKFSFTLYTFIKTMGLEEKFANLN